jgi:hypothetical protein
LETLLTLFNKDLLLISILDQQCLESLKDYVHTKPILWYSDSRIPEENEQLLKQLIVNNLPKEDKDYENYC